MCMYIYICIYAYLYIYIYVYTYFARNIEQGATPVSGLPASLTAATAEESVDQ